MQRAYYYDGIRVDAATLNYDITAKNSTVTNRIKAILNSVGIPVGSGSIVGRPGDSALFVTGSGGTLTISPGDAIDKNGEYISVKEDTYVPSDDFEPVKPSRIVDVSSGSNGNYYFGIRYALDSGCIKSNREGESFYVRYYDSYEWVNQPGALANYGDITLATYTLTTGVVSNVVDVRANQRLSCQVDASKIYITDPVVPTITTLQQHMDAVDPLGTPTATNPHGTVLSTDFDDLHGAPNGLVGGAQHGVEAHDYTVPISRTSSYTMSDVVLNPTQDGGGVVWADGVKNIATTVNFIIDSEIDWKYRWVTVTGFAYAGTDASDYYPSGSKVDEMCGFIDPVTPSTSKLVYGHFYTSAGGNGSTYPYLKLKPYNSSDSLIIWVDTTNSKLMGSFDYVSADPNMDFAFGLSIEYGPTRKKV